MTYPAKLRRFYGFIVFVLVLAGNSSMIAARGIQVKLIDGRVCAQGKIMYSKKEIETNIIINLGSNTPLTLIPNGAKGLGLRSPEEARAARLNIAFGRGSNAMFRNLSPVIAAKSLTRDLNRFTADNAPALEEIPVFAIIGLGAFGRGGVILELNKKVIRILTPKELDLAMKQPLKSDDEKLHKSVILPMVKNQWGYEIAGESAGDIPIRVMFSTAHHDTCIDTGGLKTAALFGGQDDYLNISGIKMSDYAAGRFVDLNTKFGMPVGAIIGTAALQYFNLTIDPSKNRLKIKQTRVMRSAKTISSERTFFKALADKDADGIEAYLEKNNKTRLSEEAAFALTRIRLQSKPYDQQATKRAVAMVDEYSVIHRRCRYLNSIVDFMASMTIDPVEKAEIMSYTLKLALACSSKDLEGTAAHQVHLRLGKTALAQKNIRLARVHLLSAAFGMPKHPETNYFLGLVYEKINNKLCAWSRYAQAILSGGDKDPIPADAYTRFHNMINDPEFRNNVSIIELEQMLEGRLPEGMEFHPDDRFTDKENKDKPHVKLVEHFTSTWDVDSTIAEVAFGGWSDFFQDSDVAIIVYGRTGQVIDPLATPIGDTRAKIYGVREGGTTVFDGVNKKSHSMIFDPGQALVAVEEVYSNLQELAFDVENKSSAWSINGQAKQEEKNVSGKVEITGPAMSDDVRLHVILCERSVLSFYLNYVMFHRYVARQGLSPADGFTVASAQERKRSFKVDTTELASQLSKALDQAENVKDRPPLPKTAYVDPKACVFVAFLQDAKTHKVLAAKMIPVLP